MPVFENLTLDQLINSTGTISWSAESLRILYKFCSQHQISFHNLPTPELLADLLKLLGAPVTDVAAYANVAKRTVSVLRTRISLRNPALTESGGGVMKTPWECVWARWSERWFKNEDWDGDIRMPGDVTALERLPRPIVALRHSMGETSLIKALVTSQASRVTAIRTGGDPDTSNSRRVGELNARIAALEGEKLALQNQRATLEGEKTALETRNSTLTTESIDSNNRLTDLARENASLKAQNARISILTDQVSLLERQNARLNSAPSTSSNKVLTSELQKLEAENQILLAKEEKSAQKIREMYFALLRQDEEVRVLKELVGKKEVTLWKGKGKDDGNGYSNLSAQAPKVPDLPTPTASENGDGDDGRDAL
ncbi:hypothetical protein HII31_09225 [Pseudocercospora fuligena]|uniref:Uncharacterized protein n=1 Tax=Pseudocercospora fuligena TaxID=685502 RepID=A0A8H6VJV6_9PEZI|nr:hypothetical protein HII31_09225 [Pseudocercospora fuligena]